MGEPFTLILRYMYDPCTVYSRVFPFGHPAWQRQLPAGVLGLDIRQLYVRCVLYHDCVVGRGKAGSGRRVAMPSY